MKIPGQPEVEAAWHALPAETRDRIGIIAVDLVFQEFVHGDAYVVSGNPKDRAVPGRGKAVSTIRAAAWEAGNRRLNELHRVVEESLPNLFGPEGENPAWCANPGATPKPSSPAPPAVAVAATKREVAAFQGFTGDICPACSSFAMRRAGTCLACQECGTTTGCS